MLASILLLLFGIYFLKQTVPGRRTDTYYARFSQVSNLDIGDPVKVNGVNVGKVKAIELEGSGVKVTFEMRRGVFLNRDADLRIQNIGLMGERQIGIRLGQSSEAVLPGALLEGTLDAGIAEAMGVAGEVFIEADSLVKTLRNLVDSTLGRPEFAGRVNGLLASTEDLTQRLSKLEQDMDPQIREGVKNLNSVSREVDGFVREQKPRMEEIVRNGNEVSRHAKELAERSQRVAQGLEDVLAKMNSKNGTLGALLTDSTLHRDLRAALRSADTLFRTVNRKGLDVNVDFF